MSRAGRIYSRLSPHLAHRPGSALVTKLHAGLIRRTRGRLGTRFFGGAPLLVLRTTGRRSGKLRESPMLFVPAERGVAVFATNAASPRPPAWWLNLQAEPRAEALIDGSWVPVRARQAHGREAAELLARLERAYSGAEHYRRIATREHPVVVLEPVD